MSWDIYNQLKEFNNTKRNKENFDNEAYEIVENIKDYLKLTNEPSLSHSLILKEMLDFYKTCKKDYINLKQDLDLISFCKKWNMNNFREGKTQKYSDFIPYTSQYEGKKRTYTSLALKATRMVLEEAIDNKDKENIKYFLPYLNKVIDLGLEELTWARYTRAKCYKFLGDFENAKNDMLFVLDQKSREPWAWNELGEIFALNDKDIEFACYCKALSLINEKQEGYVGKIREKLADLLIERGDLSAAKYELNQIHKYRTKNEYKIEEKFEQKLKSLENIKSTNDNISLYAKHTPLVDKFVPKKEYSKISSELLDKVRDFSGKVKLNEKGFAFVDDIFISSHLVSKYNLKNNEKISGKAIPNQQKKNTFKAISIVKNI